MVGQDFSVSGPNDGHFCPETYFDVEVLTRGLVAVKMVWEWRDQVESLFFPFVNFLNFSGLWQPKGSVVAPAGEEWSGKS